MGMGLHNRVVQQTFLLYVWEFGGSGVEVAHAGTRLIPKLDWNAITWTRAGEGRA
ncbi:VOC family protein [Roseomonas populi]|uniref:Uncharacterized protein n=1 Tax=Roseomonas populi TaxID=3121582 RepID=A0ABT1X2N3_9PROT|nr:hypothetical protein [Roseomonas pecuniae]MCR0982376.1 hypothetical protein [Roseomonas pecuniae]